MELNSGKSSLYRVSGGASRSMMYSLTGRRPNVPTARERKTHSLLNILYDAFLPAFFVATALHLWDYSFSFLVRERSEPKGKPASELADSYLIHLMNVTRFFIIKQYQRSECVVDARDKTRLSLIFLEPEGLFFTARRNQLINLSFTCYI